MNLKDEIDKIGKSVKVRTTDKMEFNGTLVIIIFGESIKRSSIGLKEKTSKKEPTLFIDADEIISIDIYP